MMKDFDINKTLAEANAFIDNRQFLRAKQLYKRICQASKEDATVWMMLGSLNGETDNLPEAASCLREAIRLRPAYPEARYNLANVLRMQGDLEGAQTSLEAAVADQPDYAAAWLLMGSINGMLGRLERAEECLRKAAAIQPDSLDVHMNLASALVQQGKLEEAVTTYQRAIGLQPGLAPAWSRLGTIQAELNRLEEAQTSARQAIKLQADFTEARLLLGNVLRAQNRLDEAAAVFERLASAQPELAEGHAGLGMVLHQQDKFDAAEASYLRALQIDADQATIHFNLGVVFQEQRRFARAKECYHRAIQIRPDYAKAYAHLGHALRSQGRAPEAVTHFERALTLVPDSAEIQHGLGRALMESGRHRKAAAGFRRLIETDPTHAYAYTDYAYADLAKALHYAEQDRGGTKSLSDYQRESIDMMEREIDSREPLPPASRRRLHFSLGTLYDAVGDYDKAFIHFQNGNMFEPPTFNQAQHTVETESLVSVFQAGFVAQMPRAGNRSELPVFIVGMPRSGTSLVEQILASHPAVYGAGELLDIDRMAKDLHILLHMDQRYPYCVPLLTQENLNYLAQGYLDRLTEISAHASRITDKNPGNFTRLGLIEMLFPRARAIHCVRNPLDTCLSNFFQDFGQGQKFAFNLSNLGTVYREYERLMQHWKAALNIPIMEVRYETLVSDPESVSRSIVEFCGLNWDDRCLRFHETKRLVGTASNDQVRNPIYTASLDRWKHYERYLGPLKEALQSPKASST